MNLTAVVVTQNIFKLYRVLIKKIQVPKLMLEMIIVAQQILIPFSKKEVLIMLCRQQDHSVALHPCTGIHTEERDW